MKTIFKLTLMIGLLGTSVFADGDMPGGNRECPPEGCPPPPCTEDCSSGMMAQRTNGETETFAESFYIGTDLAIDFVKDTVGLF